MQTLRSLSRRATVVVLAASLLAACGGDDGDTQAVGEQTPPPVSGNAAPIIQGQATTSVLAGQNYSFQPAASDPDGDALTFSIANLPSWASFDTATGRLTGSPTSADIATYSNITIAVSDGSVSASLSPFSIVVSAVGTGSATLSWMPPTQNSDGSTLTDLAGYEVRYGRSAEDLTQTISLTNPSLSAYVVENLTSGTWYFAVSAVNASGVTSPLSNVASKVIG